MRIIYLSKTCSKKEFQKLYEKSHIKPQQQDQKFHQMMIDGIHLNGAHVTAISSRPINRLNLKKVFFTHHKDIEEGISYIHLGFINFKFMRQFTLFMNTVIYLFFSLIKSRKDTYLIVDPLNYSLSMSALFISNIFRIPLIALVTDLPNELEGSSKRFKKVTTKLLKKYHQFIFLSEYANDQINIKQRPYLIIEGMVYPDMLHVYPDDEIFTILYAGNLSKTSGIELLIEAFNNLKLESAQLKICGDGELSSYVKEEALKNNDIIYLGTIPNKEVMVLESKAKLLINPRRSSDKQTLYAFPSKIMEYLLSETPVLSTRLKGIPSSYEPYITYVKEESIEGFMESILYFYEMDNDKRKELGKKGRAFVLECKTNNIQAKKVIEFMRKG